MRDKARLLPAVAAVTAPVLLGVAAALGISAIGPSAGTRAVAGKAGTGPGATGDAGPLIPMLGSARLASFSLPVAQLRRGGTADVAPLRGLLQADMIVVAPSSLSAGTLPAIRRLPGVTAAQSVEAAKIQVNGKFTAVLGVDPSAFRGFAAPKTAASDRLWQSVADGGMAVSYTMGKLDKLLLGGTVHVAGAKRENLPVGGFGTVGIEGVDAVVSDAVARSLGMPAANAIVISAPHASLASLAAAAKRVLPHAAAVEPLMTQVAAGVTKPEATAAGVAAAGSAGALGSTAGALTQSEATSMLSSALSRRGMPYIWGAAGPSSFDCSGLVQWSYARAGVRMPRVAADQARTGPAVPVSQLQPGDLLFYHTDPTAPGYISHVAIYIGNGLMIQAPEPGMDVEIVPVSIGTEFAGAIRVDPALAAAVAGSI
ncbi:MAG TPA: C40 family peptidase [Streptosporangiaceae bacterium]|nr:C40 family peptidase [Streptosporangiaceae bacterium]